MWILGVKEKMEGEVTGTGEDPVKVEDEVTVGTGEDPVKVEGDRVRRIPSEGGR